MLTAGAGTLHKQDIVELIVDFSALSAKHQAHLASVPSWPRANQNLRKKPKGYFHKKYISKKVHFRKKVSCSIRFLRLRVPPWNRGSSKGFPWYSDGINSDGNKDLVGLLPETWIY